jgi:hypothetical protein
LIVATLIIVLATLGQSAHAEPYFMSCFVVININGTTTDHVSDIFSIGDDSLDTEVKVDNAYRDWLYKHGVREDRVGVLDLPTCKASSTEERAKRYRMKTFERDKELVWKTVEVHWIYHGE